MFCTCTFRQYLVGLSVRSEWSSSAGSGSIGSSPSRCEFLLFRLFLLRDFLPIGADSDLVFIALQEDSLEFVLSLLRRFLAGDAEQYLDVNANLSY